MICPFRVGIKYEYTYIDPDNQEGRQKSENYIEVAQHALFEKCNEGECPYYNYAGFCNRTGDD